MTYIERASLEKTNLVFFGKIIMFLFYKKKEHKFWHKIVIGALKILSQIIS